MLATDVVFMEVATKTDLPPQLDVGTLYFVKDQAVIWVNHGDRVSEYGGAATREMLDKLAAMDEEHRAMVDALKNDMAETLAEDIATVRDELANMAQEARDSLDEIADVTEELKDITDALWQPYTPIPSYDFTVNIPTQEALTTYARSQISQAQLDNGAIVTNLYDGSDWFYDPRMQRWNSYGSSGLTIANTEKIGLVKASTGKGNIAVKADGTMRPVDCETTLTRAAYDALASKNPNILYSVTETDGTFSFYLGVRQMRLSELSVKPLDDRITKLEGTTIIRTAVELPRVMRGVALIPKSTLPADAIVAPKRLEIFDDFGTRATYIAEPTPGTFEFHTISTSAMPDLEPHLLGTVATKALLPTNVSAFVAPAPVCRQYDYIHVQADETNGGQTVRYYVNAISSTGVITWGSPLVVNIGNYQTKSTVAMGGKLLVGGATEGSFGTALTVANTTPETPNDTQVMTAGAVMSAIENVEVDLATDTTAGIVKGTAFTDTTAGRVRILEEGTMGVNGWSVLSATVDTHEAALTAGVKAGLANASPVPTATNPFMTKANVDDAVAEVSGILTKATDMLKTDNVRFKPPATDLGSGATGIFPTAPEGTSFVLGDLTFTKTTDANLRVTSDKPFTWMTNPDSNALGFPGAIPEMIQAYHAGVDIPAKVNALEANWPSNLYGLVYDDYNCVSFIWANQNLTIFKTYIPPRVKAGEFITALQDRLKSEAPDFDVTWPKSYAPEGTNVTDIIFSKPVKYAYLKFIWDTPGGILLYGLNSAGEASYGLHECFGQLYRMGGVYYVEGLAGVRAVLYLDANTVATSAKFTLSEWWEIPTKLV
jgi:hypothetical protein